MRPSKIFLASIIFFGLFTGGNMFMGSLWSNHNVNSQTSLTVQQDYDKIKDSVQGNNSMYSKINTLSTDEGSVLDAASAGLLLVPQFVGVLLTPIEALVSTLQSVSAEFGILLPEWFVVMLQLMIISTVAYGIYSIATGVRS